MRILLATIGLTCVLYAPGAHACGHCVEDKIAAVYDYATVSKAQALGLHVAFLAIDGPVIANDKTRRAIEDDVRMLDGVDRASVRVSLELAALSFVFDPRRSTFASLQRSIGKKMSRRGLRVSEMKILDGSETLPKTANR